MKDSDRGAEGPLEIAVAGDLTENQADLCDKLLSVEPGGECILYFDSLGGSPYCGIALTSLITLRGLRATGIVAGECSSAALWPFAACQRRLVTPLSVLLFHNMKWQSEENVGLLEAAEWARHFGQLEKDMDVLLAQLFGIAPEKIAEWTRAGRYVSGPEVGRGGAGRTGRVEAAGPGETPPQVMTQRTSRRDFLLGPVAGREAGTGDGSPRRSRRRAVGRLVLAMNPTWSISPARRWPASSRFACPSSIAGEATAAALEALDLVQSLERQLSFFRPDSDISAINRDAADAAVEVEPRLFALLQRAMQLWRDSGGAYDLTATPLWEAWGFARRAGAIPSPEQLAEAQTWWADNGSNSMKRERRSACFAGECG